MRPSEFKIRYDPNLDRYVMSMMKLYTVKVLVMLSSQLERNCLEKQLKALQRQQLKVQLQRRPQKLVSMLVKRLVIK